eukprot:31190-Pelagococcus_subviridis.AAC.1
MAAAGRDDAGATAIRPAAAGLDAAHRAPGSDAPIPDIVIDANVPPGRAARGARVGVGLAASSSSSSS